MTQDEWLFWIDGLRTVINIQNENIAALNEQIKQMMTLLTKIRIQVDELKETQGAESSPE